MLIEQGNRRIFLFPCFFVVLHTLLSLEQTELQAGAWTRERGEVYSKAAVASFRSDAILDPKGRELPSPPFADDSFFLYTEYGITPDWTAIFSGAVKRLSFEAPTEKRTEAGVSDAWFLIKRSILRTPLVVSVQAGAKVPLGYGPDSVPPLGQGQVDWESRLLLGRSFHPLPVYAGVEIGYRRRNGPFSDEIPYRIESGIFAGKKFLVQLALDGIDNRLNDDAGEIETFATRPPNIFDQEYLKFRPALVYLPGKGFAIELGYETILAGGNTASGESFSFGVGWQGRL